MRKITIPAATLLLVSLIGIAPLTASAPVSVASASAPVSKIVAKASGENLVSAIRVQDISVKLIFDGVSLTPPKDQIVFIHNNTTYVPLRFMSYALQKTVSWDSKNKQVTISDPTSSELVAIKEYLINITKNNNADTGKNYLVNPVTAKYIFNGSSKSLPSGQLSLMKNGTLYVPLRFLSESVGKKITWDQKSKTITSITNEGQGKVEESSSIDSNASSNPSTSAPTGSGSSGEKGKLSYDAITSSALAKLNSLKSQSQSTLMSTAFEYLAATDEASKASIKAKGLQQLSDFTASFNGIISDTEQQLKDNGYSTDIIAEYRSAFEADLEAGRKIAESMGN